LIKFCENFSLGFLLNQYQTYQDNLCGVYLALSSLFESGVIQNSVTCIKQSTPSQDHITCLGWLTSFPRALSNAVLKSSKGANFILQIKQPLSEIGMSNEYETKV